MEYHVIVKGFDKVIRDREGKVKGNTEIRHYRYSTEAFTMILADGAYQFKSGKEFRGFFPVNATMVLVEEEKERDQE